MTFELSEPVLVIGLGGLGSRLAGEIHGSLGFDCMTVSNDGADLEGQGDSVRIKTGSILNPSSQAIRGFALESVGRIRDKVSGYSSIIMVANLAGRAGTAVAPMVSSMCKEEGKNLVSFTVMPFGYENDRIFAAGVSLRRIKADSDCTVIVDNDAMLESNPDLTTRECYEMANSAILHMAESLRSSDVPDKTNVLSVGRGNDDTEASLRDSFKMLYGSTPPDGGVKSSIIHVLGGEDIPVGVMKTIAGLSRGAADDSAMVRVSPTGSGIVMLSAVQAQTKFDEYDPLGIIPEEDSLDMAIPDCSYDCKLDMYQAEYA